jgi:two-component system sensor histidine kinase SenX3
MMVPMESLCASGIGETARSSGVPGSGPCAPAAAPTYEELRAGFAGVVSHELRTPLARLLSIVESALLPEADLHGIVKAAQCEIAAMGELIDDVLLLSQLETGNLVVAAGASRALDAARSAVAEFAHGAERARVAIVVEGDEDAAIPVRESMFRAVVRNLVENAVRYAGPGATLRLSVRREAGALVLAASDDGVGVPEAALTRLFERFFRADPARADRGSGLGLAIVKHIVVAAGGWVEARGAPGRGLTVRCTFPVTG